MIKQPRLLDLLEEAFAAGVEPDQCSSDNPNLSLELRRGLAACDVLSDELDVLFPTEADQSEGKPEASSNSLPRIAGYELISVLGFGGMGVVYKARHLALNRLVAIKMMASSGRSARVDRRRIQQEAESLATLKHPHIVQVFDVGELDGIPYYTMEIMDGGSLAQKLKAMPQSADYAASTMIDLSMAAEAAHKCGIIHRDLKPANILLTADGIPKMSDFGLARRIEHDDFLTLPGARMGTPSYMAPEQAAKRFGEIGPASDVYALGAILYEIMTGRPPFRGETSAETERQLLHEEVVPPKRLNARVPRDLETICLKCLQKIPSRRYPSAAELSCDLMRWKKGEPIAARRTGRIERIIKLARRRPAAATALVAALLLISGASGGVLWLTSQRAAAAAAVAEDVNDAIASQRLANWDRAAGALERAESRLRGVGGGGPAWVRDKLAAANRDQTVVEALNKARIDALPILNDTPDRSRTANTYAAVFSQLGIGSVADDPQVAGAKIRESNVRSAILTALDEWWSCRRSNPEGNWIAAVACAADPDPTGWRDQVRQLRSSADKRVIADLAQRADVAQQPIELLIHLGDDMRSAGLDPIPFYIRVTQARPGDAWANFTLGYALCRAEKYHIAVEYCRAATALQPHLLAMQIALAEALRGDGRVDEALANLHEAAIADPSQSFYPLITAAILLKSERYGEALAAAAEAQRLSAPDQMRPVLYQAKALMGLGRTDESFVKYQLAVSLDHGSTEALLDLREALLATGRLNELEREWGRALTHYPSNLDAWKGYAELCLYLGDAEAYCRARAKLLDAFSGVNDPRECEYVGRACLLLPASPEECQRATKLIDRALATTGPGAKTYLRFFRLAKALADYRAGRFQQALASVEGGGPPSPALRPTQKLIAAMSHERLGDHDAALAALHEAIAASDGSNDPPANQDQWINHILRLQAAEMIIPTSRKQELPTAGLPATQQ